jgi:hypothetical protein
MADCVDFAARTPEFHRKVKDCQFYAMGAPSAPYWQGEQSRGLPEQGFDLKL